MESKKLDAIVSPELIHKALELVQQNKKYRSLKEQLAKYEKQKNYFKVLQIKQLMEAVQQEVVEKLAAQEIEERKNTEALVAMLPQEEGEKYRDYLNALCFCFDAIDFIITDINDLLKYNEVGFNVESLPEIKQCKDKVISVLNIDIRKMDEAEQWAYGGEADGIVEYLYKRGGIFRRRMDNYRKKKEKTAQKA